MKPFNIPLVLPIVATAVLLLVQVPPASPSVSVDVGEDRHSAVLPEIAGTTGNALMVTTCVVDPAQIPVSE